METKDITSEEIESEEDSGFKRFLTTRNIFNALLILIVANLVFLDIMLLQGGVVKTIEKIITNKPIISQNNSNDQTFCSEACITKINDVVQSLNKTLPTQALTPTPTTSVKVQNNTTQTNQSSTPKEYYVPFGSGSGNSSDWQEVPGLQANIDSGSYGTIKTVDFEVSLHIPSGNEIASVRLYNSTDGRAIANSQLDFNGNSSSMFLSSKPITLDFGNKLYKVQMLTQLQSTAIVDQSRVHITAQ